MDKFRNHCLVCTGTGCVSNGAFEVKKALEEELTRLDLQDEVQVIGTGCNGFCERGPVMVVQPEGILYQQLKPEDIPMLVEEHFLKGRPLTKHLYSLTRTAPEIPLMRDIGFFKDHAVLLEIYLFQGSGQEFLLAEEIFNAYLFFGRLEFVNLFHD